VADYVSLDELLVKIKGELEKLKPILGPILRVDCVEKLKNGVEAKIRYGSVATSIRQ
jgi:hypothetical protein